MSERLFYRVWAPREERPYHNLPCGTQLTGFWGPREQVLAIARAHAEFLFYDCGVYSVPVRVAVAPESALVLAPPPPGAKTAHVPAFDDGEVFAVAVDESRVGDAWAEFEAEITGQPLAQVLAMRERRA